MKKSETDALVREAWARAKAKKGGALPTAKEVALETELRPKFVGDVLRRQGIDFERLKHGKAPVLKKTERGKGEEDKRRALIDQQRTELSEIFSLAKQERAAHGRVLARCASARAVRAEGALRPGHSYDKSCAVMAECPKCGRQKIIWPRMHAWWAKEEGGSLIAVCSDQCAGVPLLAKIPMT